MQLISAFAAAMLCTQLAQAQAYDALSTSSGAPPMASSTPVSNTARYPVPASFPPIVLVDRTSHAYVQRQDPFLTLQGLFLLSHSVCAEPGVTGITAEVIIETKIMRMLIVPNAGGGPLLRWATVCDAVRGMGEDVAGKNLWYKLRFSIAQDIGGGLDGAKYGVLLTEMVDPRAVQGLTGAVNGTDGVGTARKRARGVMEAGKD